MPKSLDAIEKDALDIVERHLGVPVVQHDDNTESSAPDLRIEYPDKIGLVEVVSDVNQRHAELSAALQDRGARLVPELSFDWSVRVTTRTRLKKTDKVIVGLLSQAEQAGRKEVLGTPYDGIDPLGPELFKYGIVEARSFTPSSGRPGTVMYYTTQGITWDGTLDQVTGWVEEVLRLASDVPDKLARAAGDERHAFLVSAFRGDMSVNRSLWKPHPRNGAEAASMPTTAPVLPSGVDNVWVRGPERVIAWFPSSGWVDVAT